MGDTEQLVNILESRPHHKPLIFDTETTYFLPLKCRLVSIGFGWEPDRAYYIPISHLDHPTNLSLKQVQEVFGRYLSDSSIEKGAQNASYDYLVAKRHGMDVRGLAHDPLIASYLLDPEIPHNLDYMAQSVLGVDKIHYAQLVGDPKTRTIDMVNVKDASLYCCEDVVTEVQMIEHFESRVKDFGMWDLYQQIEMPVLPILADMQYRGILVDKSFFKPYELRLRTQMKELEEQIFKLAGTRFELTSHHQIRHVLFDKLNLKVRNPDTDFGPIGPKTSKLVLQNIALRSPICDAIVKWKSLNSLLTKYATKLPGLVEEDGTIHCEINQARVVTGRLSSSNPNLMNIPVRSEIGKEIRGAFIARPGYKLVDGDYSQIELRVMAHYSQDPNLLRAYREGIDLHAQTAKRAFQLKDREPDDMERFKGKKTNFLLIYGGGYKALAEQLIIPDDEALALSQSAYAEFPEILTHMRRMASIGRSQGYVEDIFGRKRFLPDLEARDPKRVNRAELQAYNQPIQASAAGILKLALIGTRKMIEEKGFDAHLLLSVHDEILCEVADKDVEAFRPEFKRTMENVTQLSVPLEAEVHSGNNWSSCK